MSPARTLYEDWTSRRAALASPAEGDHVARTVARILDYLLERYRGAPEASTPVRAPPRRELCVDDRAIVLHAHLSRGLVAGVQSAAAARQRVGDVLTRMQAAPSGDDFDPNMEGPPLRRARRSHDEGLRMLLGPAAERMDGLQFLWLYGDLRDVGLLCDLLELPPPADESPEERPAMLWVLERLSERDGPEERLSARDCPPWWPSVSLYQNWLTRHTAVEPGWLLGEETADVKGLLGQLLQRYIYDPQARSPAFSVSDLGANNARTRVVATYCAPGVEPPLSFHSFGAWQRGLANRGYSSVAAAPDKERQGWANAARRQLIDKDESKRLSALKALTLVGDLHDVGLMCDLLALTSEGQTGRERAAMVQLLRIRATT